jgi:SAM-dependent methyltransferase
MTLPKDSTPPVCSYEGSDYQESFWEHGGRAYEDAAEAIALKHMLPRQGRLMLELGAGAGRNTPRYRGFEHIVLLDYSSTQLQQAQERLGRSSRYTYVAADIYRLPFVDGIFDAATMIRTLHHMAEPQRALRQVRNTLQPGGTFILEFANKQNLKAILRFLMRRQEWNPFTLESVEYIELNFDFHPRAVFGWLKELGFIIQSKRTVSHFRVGLLKRLVPAKLLAAVDGLVQPTGALWQLSPSVFVKAIVEGNNAPFPNPSDPLSLFKCPACGYFPLGAADEHLACNGCGRKWAVRDGIYDFKEPLC